MSDPSATGDTAVLDRGVTTSARAVRPESRSLEAKLAAQRAYRREQSLLDRDELAAEMRRSRSKADQVLAQRAREAGSIQRDQPTVTKPLRDPFGAGEVGTENVSDPAQENRTPEYVGVPRLTSDAADRELEGMLADIARRKQRNPPADLRLKNVVQLSDLWETLSSESQARVGNALSTVRPLDPVKDSKTTGFSVKTAVRLLGQLNVGTLRKAGAKVPGQYADSLPLNHKDLNTIIYYVGPGVGVMFYPTGEMVEFPFGPAFEVDAVHEYAKPNGGMFFSSSRFETVRLHPSVEYQGGKGSFRVRTAGPQREWRTINAFLERRGQEGNQQRGQWPPILFVISPSYWKRRGVRRAFTGLPDRVWRAAAIAFQKNYFHLAAEAQGKAIQNMEWSDVAKQVVDVAIDVLSPLPSYDDLEDATRIGRANMMAMWGGSDDVFIESDLDIAARLYAREAVAQLASKAVKSASKVGKAAAKAAKEGGSALPKDSGAGQLEQVEARPVARGSEVAEPKAEPVTPKGGEDPTHRPDTDLTAEQEARAVRFAETELRNIRRGQTEDTRSTDRASAVEDTRNGDRKIEGPSTARPHEITISSDGPSRRETLDDANEQQLSADYHWAQLTDRSRKTVAYSEGRLTTSGYGYSKNKMDFRQRAAPQGGLESHYYVRRYEELAGSRSPLGMDNKVPGSEYAAHAEIKNRIHQFDDGENKPTGVSNDMCGNCRQWHREVAVKQNQEIVVADPSFIRVFNPDGTVEIYTLNGKLVRTVPSNVPPAASIRTGYYGIDW